MEFDLSETCDAQSSHVLVAATIFCLLGGFALTNANYGMMSSGIFLRGGAIAQLNLEFIVISLAQGGGAIVGLGLLFSVLYSEDNDLGFCIFGAIYGALNLIAGILIIIFIIEFIHVVNVGCYILLVTTFGAAVSYVIIFILTIDCD